jgi:3-deoxy-D-manno-octulosonic-acid transferase
VGEAKSALAILSALPAAGATGPKVLSVATPAGLAAARDRLWPGIAPGLEFPNLPLGVRTSREPKPEAAPKIASSLASAPDSPLDSAPAPDPGFPNLSKGVPTSQEPSPVPAPTLAPRLVPAPALVPTGGPDPALQPDTALAGVQLMAPPLDFWGAPGRCLSRLDPSGLVIVETELWPELLWRCHQKGVPVMVVAGRLSERSARRYGAFRRLIGPMLRSIRLIAAITEADRQRYIDLGADPARVLTIGSPKFDPLISLAQTTRDAGGPAPPEGPLPLIVAGSTHPGEEALILSALSDRLPGKARLVLAPRHVGRAAEVLALAAGKDLPASLLSEDPELSSAVTIVDQMGILGDLYRRAAVCLVGGSLSGGSGHDPLEPAARGRPVVFGPGMSSFASEAAELVRVGAALRSDPDRLSEVLGSLLDSPVDAAARGLKGCRHVASLTPVAPVLARLVVETIGPPNAKAGAGSSGHPGS